MGLFKTKKRRDFIDLTEKYNRQVESKSIPIQSNSNQTESSEVVPFPFFGADAGSSSSTIGSSSDDYLDISGGVEEKRKKLAKRLLDMTNKIEDLSNQIYHLQQRIEVLERKSGVGGFD